MNDNTLTLQIEPLDTLFFRDGKPFSMGDDTWADGVFPPAPSVIYGALRTTWASQNNITNTKEINKLTKDLIVSKIQIVFENNLYFQLPLDLIIKKYVSSKPEEKKRKEEKKYTVYLLDKFKKTYNNIFPFGDLILFDDENEQVENLDKGLISRDELVKYAEKTTKDFTVYGLQRFFHVESKIGIARDNKTAITEESNLYRVGMLRFSDLKFLVTIKGLTFESSGILKIGGENKVAKYSVLNPLQTSKYKDFKINLRTKEFKLIFTTPTFFKNGYLPEWIDNKAHKAQIGNYEFTLKNAIIGKPLNIGGFDMLERKPKPMLKLIPAGSILYFETKEELDPYEIFSTNNLCDDKNLSKQGYGQFIIAKL